MRRRRATTDPWPNRRPSKNTEPSRVGGTRAPMGAPTQRGTTQRRERVLGGRQTPGLRRASRGGHSRRQGPRGLIEDNGTFADEQRWMGGSAAPPRGAGRAPLPDGPSAERPAAPPSALPAHHPRGQASRMRAGARAVHRCAAAAPPPVGRRTTRPPPRPPRGARGGPRQRPHGRRPASSATNPVCRRRRRLLTAATALRADAPPSRPPPPTETIRASARTPPATPREHPPPHASVSTPDRTAAAASATPARASGSGTAVV
ncbi:hypothetical protein BU14_0053s0032 [Porphyra umbilicalis]|uniref:Uncharacterized protein n=1 Tax=Porphyra umbilicalis TaxID=2786 RepID=A0A1X6PI53_PORUM|nr:hypothetical protein BU14_0053s0032 [Porphyra umbilicalis]|eukprot:OSX80368.1 hypothetical protein BU14_0053s0032 [Porphyra umbilicalis]